MPLWSVFNGTVLPEEHFIQYTLSDAKERVVSSNFLFPVPIKKARGVSSVPPEVTIQSNKCESFQQKVTLSVRTTVPILLFYIDILNEGVRDYQLSDNGFMLVEPVTTMTITYPNADCAGSILGIQDIKVYTVNQYM